MNTAACRRLDAEDFFAEDLHSATQNEEGVSLFNKLTEIVDHACSQPTWPEFKTILRQQGPDMRAIVARLDELRPRREEHESVASKSDSEPEPRTLGEVLASIDVSDRRVGLVDQAQRIIARAHATSHLIDAHACGLTGEARQQYDEGERSSWMYTFSQVALWRIAFVRKSPTAPCVQFAVQLAVNSSREAYAHYATALELSDAAA
ncbi:MAG: hypothetical protein JKY37_21160 [Nannocystaceae bacterium]|nr:hypothetical protein [Nannocystaceae bacterium]